MKAHTIDRRLADFELNVERVPESGCWVWMGKLQPNGYGRFNLNGIRDYVHRQSHRMFTGEIPGDQFVLHRCDNRDCVNPHHLFLGSNRDNLDDMMAKGRQTLGEKNPRAKLTAQQVSEIRVSAEDAKALAAKYFIHVRHVYALKSGRRWAVKKSKAK